jgi:hypothetical protein
MGQREEHSLSVAPAAKPAIVPFAPAVTVAYAAKAFVAKIQDMFYKTAQLKPYRMVVVKP